MTSSTRLAKLAAERLGIWLAETVTMGMYKTHHSAEQLVEHEPSTLDFALIVAKREALARKRIVEVRRGPRVLATYYSDGTLKMSV